MQLLQIPSFELNFICMVMYSWCITSSLVQSGETTVLAGLFAGLKNAASSNRSSVAWSQTAATRHKMHKLRLRRIIYWVKMSTLHKWSSFKCLQCLRRYRAEDSIITNLPFLAMPRSLSSSPCNQKKAHSIHERFQMMSDNLMHIMGQRMWLSYHTRSPTLNLAAILQTYTCRVMHCG